MENPPFSRIRYRVANKVEQDLLPSLTVDIDVVELDITGDNEFELGCLGTFAEETLLS